MSSKKSLDRTYTIAVSLLVVSLAFANIYLFVKSKDAINVLEQENQSVLKGQTSTDAPAGKWEEFIADEIGYRVSYPQALEPRSLQNENYLSTIIFFVPDMIVGHGYGVSVRETTLEEEIVLVKKEIGEGVTAKLTEENSITNSGFSGTRLEFEPIEASEGEPRSVVVINNGTYSYILSGHPEILDKVISTFSLIQK